MIAGSAYFLNFLLEPTRLTTCKARKLATGKKLSHQTALFDVTIVLFCYYLYSDPQQMFHNIVPYRSGGGGEDSCYRNTQGTPAAAAMIDSLSAAQLQSAWKCSKRRKSQDGEAAVGGLDTKSITTPFPTNEHVGTEACLSIIEFHFHDASAQDISQPMPPPSRFARHRNKI